MLIPNDIKQSVADNYKHTSGMHTIVVRTIRAVREDNQSGSEQVKIVIDNTTMKNYVHNCTCVSCSIFDWSMEVYKNKMAEKYLAKNPIAPNRLEEAISKYIDEILK
jgi:hypothetical protein